MNRPSTVVSLLCGVSAVILASGCGAQRASEKTSAPPSTESAPAGGESDREVLQQGFAPAPEAQSAPAAGAPGGPASTRKDDEGASGFEPLWRSMEGALTLSSPNCVAAWAFHDRICDLAQRLCDLATRSAEPEMVESCRDGRLRCERATERVRATCPSP